jgi:DNA-binding LytR/AlgR family response regulator
MTPTKSTPAPALRCLVVDDQPSTLDHLARMLRAEPSVATVSTAADSADALRVLGDLEVDVAFLEVRMPGLDGMELAWVLNRFRAAPAVVFVTRYPGRAADAFDLGAVDFLSKPPRPDRLAESLRRVAATHHAARVAHPATSTARPGAARPASTTPGTGSAASAGAYADDQAIPIELGGTTRLVWRSTVRWVQARGDYARLHTAEGSYLIRARMAALADSWRTAGLVRIHRSYLVQLRSVAEVRVTDSGRLTVVVDGHQLPVSRRMEPKVHSQLRYAARTGGAQARPTATR